LGAAEYFLRESGITLAQNNHSLIHYNLAYLSKNEKTISGLELVRLASCAFRAD
jgi:hypothetical protein